jgi:hypothetical protein
MKTLRIITVGFASLLGSLAVPLLITTATLQLTIFNRDTVKGWLTTSDIYHKLMPTIFASQKSLTDIPIANEKVEAALTTTYTPDYIKQQTESALDGIYDWVEGKKPAVEFSLPTNQKRDTFIEQLALQLEPELANLPLCTTTAQLDNFDGTCRPPTMTAKKLAMMIATQAADQAGSLLNQPMTPQTFTQQDPSIAKNAQELQSLPNIAQLVGSAVTILPWVIAGCLLLMAVSSINRLHTLRSFSKGQFFGTIFGVLLAGILWYLSAHIPPVTDDHTVLTLLQPFFILAVGSIAGWLLLFTSITLIVSGLGWAIFGALEHRQRLSASIIVKNTPPTTTPM